MIKYENLLFFEKLNRSLTPAEKRLKKEKVMVHVNKQQENIDKVINSIKKISKMDDKSIKLITRRILNGKLPNKEICEFLFGNEKKSGFSFYDLDQVSDLAQLKDFGISEKDLKLYYKLTGLFYKIEEAQKKITELKKKIEGISRGSVR